MLTEDPLTGDIYPLSTQEKRVKRKQRVEAQGQGTRQAKEDPNRQLRRQKERESEKGETARQGQEKRQETKEKKNAVVPVWSVGEMEGGQRDGKTWRPRTTLPSLLAQHNCRGVSLLPVVLPLPLPLPDVTIVESERIDELAIDSGRKGGRSTDSMASSEDA